MKFDIQLTSLNGTARVEIRTAKEKGGWAAYVGFAAERGVDETCFVLGQHGIPHRFAARSQQEAEDDAKEFLEHHYRIVRTIW